MALKKVVYPSAMQTLSSLSITQHNKDSKDGLSWVCNFYTAFAAVDSWKRIGKSVYLSWKFEWDEMEWQKHGGDGFSGPMTVWIKRDEKFVPLQFNVELTHSGQLIRKRIGTLEETAISCNDNNRCFYFKFCLSRIWSPKSQKTRLASENQLMSAFCDSVLVVEEQKINVNKNYLSMRSEFFNTLFNSDFKEKSMEEIPINDVKYEDFRRLLNLIHPTKPTSPTDEDVEKLLELADRFMIPAATSHVENYLLNNSDLPFGEILKLADKFKLDKLVDRCLSMLTATEHMKSLKKVIKHNELSDSTKVKLLDRTMLLF